MKNLTSITSCINQVPIFNFKELIVLRKLIVLFLKDNDRMNGSTFETKFLIFIEITKEVGNSTNEWFTP